jgi:hypothetical protein
MNAQERAKQQAEVMLAFANGAEVEFTEHSNDSWRQTKEPFWDWSLFRYRVKVVPKVVKYYCYSCGETLIWVTETQAKARGFKIRVPSEDKEVTYD